MTPAQPRRTMLALAHTKGLRGPLLIGSAGHGHGAGYLDISVKPSPTVRPRWFILYNGLEPFQHRKWHCLSDVERGVVKWLHMAGGYGRLRYQPWY